MTLTSEPKLASLAHPVRKTTLTSNPIRTSLAHPARKMTLTAPWPQNDPLLISNRNKVPIIMITTMKFGLQVHRRQFKS
jgi:hypothetical protein